MYEGIRGFLNAGWFEGPGCGLSKAVDRLWVRRHIIELVGNLVRVEGGWGLALLGPGTIASWGDSSNCAKAKAGNLML